MAAFAMSSRRLVFRQYVWPVLFAGMIFLASSRSRVVDIHVVPKGDKVVHFAVYGLFATLVCRLGRGWRGGIAALLIVSAFGVSDEWHQSFVPGRASEVADWVADTSGAALAIWLYVSWNRYRTWLEKPLWRRGPLATAGETAAPTTVGGQ